MKSFFTTQEEMEDVELNISFTTPSFYGLGTERMKYLILKIYKDGSETSNLITINVDSGEFTETIEGVTRGESSSGRLAENVNHTIKIKSPYWSTKNLILTNGIWKVQFDYNPDVENHWTNSKSLGRVASFEVDGDNITATVVEASLASIGTHGVSAISTNDIISVNIPDNKKYTMWQKLLVGHVNTSWIDTYDCIVWFDDNKLVSSTGTEWTPQATRRMATNVNFIFNKQIDNTYIIGIFIDNELQGFLNESPSYLENDIVKSDMDENWYNTTKFKFIKPIDGSNSNTPDGDINYFSLMTDTDKTDFKDEWVLTTEGSGEVNLLKLVKIKDITEVHKAIFYLK